MPALCAYLAYVHRTRRICKRYDIVTGLILDCWDADCFLCLFLYFLFESRPQIYRHPHSCCTCTIKSHVADDGTLALSSKGCMWCLCIKNIHSLPFLVHTGSRIASCGCAWQSTDGVDCPSQSSFQQDQIATIHSDHHVYNPSALGSSSCSSVNQSTAPSRCWYVPETFFHKEIHPAMHWPIAL